MGLGPRQLAWTAAAFLAFCGFLALGTWQLQRRAWKLDLIQHVGQRIHAPPTASPPPAQWPGINARDDEYRRSDGQVLVNRGFVDDAQRPAPPPEGPLRVCGLLRISEPHGGFLRPNDPAHDRWYSRDVPAIAAAHGLPASEVAPYFLDADAAADPQAWPVGALTVVQFRNAHLSYALTWYGLALLVALGYAAAVRHERGKRAGK
ncbi:MAG: SURF1 family protein [Lysobacter sp.]|nr:SURF1 family protein [Lysobacter sp.]